MSYRDRHSMRQRKIHKAMFRYYSDSIRGLIQTIRIQLENATDRKGKNRTMSKRRRIRRVIVESDLSSSDQSDADIENDATSYSSDEEYTDVEHAKSKKVSYMILSVLTIVYSYSALAPSSWPSQIFSEV
jgi:hypothetical protein